jgi:hypothetical protein
VNTGPGFWFGISLTMIGLFFLVLIIFGAGGRR